jgi:hypothetical protein
MGSAGRVTVLDERHAGQLTGDGGRRYVSRADLEVARRAVADTATIPTPGDGVPLRSCLDRDGSQSLVGVWSWDGGCGDCGQRSEVPPG